MFKSPILNKHLRGSRKRFLNKKKRKNIRTAPSRNSKDYYMWRLKVLTRDGFKCIICGETTSLHAHHIKSWFNYPKLRLKVSNGVTYCYECHEREHAFMNPDVPELTKPEREMMEASIYKDD